MHVPASAQRIAALIPGVRLIAILRNPVDRAYSAYQHVVGWGAKPPPFDEVVASVSQLPDADSNPYLWGSRYLPQLQEFRKHFTNEQMLVLLFEDLRREPLSTFYRVCDFIGVVQFQPRDIGVVHNQSRRYRSVRARLLMERVWASMPHNLMRRLDQLNCAGSVSAYEIRDPAPPVRSVCSRERRARRLAEFGPVSMDCST